MRKRSTFIFLGIAIIIIAIVLSVLLSENFIVPLMLGLVGIIVVFFTVFEQKYVSTEKIVLIALLSSLASAGRVIFAAIPSVKPTSFVIIITGMVFGSEMGFVTGAICALVSNLVLGQGPWTIWQVFCWGMMGFVSGQMSGVLKKNRIVLGAYGFLWGVLFGWIMNTWFLMSTYADTINKETIALVYIASAPMDLAHGVCNLVLLVIIGDKFIKILNRVAIKYGLTTAKSC